MLSIFSRSDEEIRREETDRVILQGLLMNPNRLQVTVKGHRDVSGRPENDQVSRDIIEAVRHIEDVVAVWDQLGVADDHLHTATS